MKGSFRAALACVALVLNLTAARAQQEAEQPRKCASAEMADRLDPELRRLLPGGDRFEAALRLARAARTAGGASCDTGQVFRIPIVFQVIHKGEPLGQGVNLPDERFTEQIAILNEDFRRKAGTPGFNTDPRGADARIEFQLAGTDPQGSYTSGIVRVNGGNRAWGLGDLDSLKAQSIWPTDQYLNMWVCDLSGGYFGLGSFPVSDLPFNGPPAYSRPDGVVLGYRYVGYSAPALRTRYNKGRTATHEIGHFLGLIHIWGDAQCGNDHCDDTPSQTQDVYDCRAVTDTNLYRCPGQPPIMIRNFLGYAYDSCMNVFTNDQVFRMRYVLCNTPERNRLTTSPGLVTQIRPRTPKGLFEVLYADRARFALQVNDSGRAIVTVFGIDGRLVHRAELTVGTARPLVFSPDVALAAGLYGIQLELNGRRQTSKVGVNLFMAK